MNIDILDSIIIIFIMLYGVIGFKRGVFKQTVLFVGTILVLVIAYKFKNVVGDFLVLNLPFFDFPKFLRGASTLNIVMYQTIGLILVAGVLMLVFKIIVSITGIFEKILRFTIVLGIPSKLLGLIVGLIEGYVIVYIALFFLSQPSFNFKFVNNSKYTPTILNKSPVLSKVAGDSLAIVNEIYDLKDIKDANELNLKIVDIVLDKKVTSVEVIEKLQNKKKIEVKNLDEIVNKYK